MTIIPNLDTFAVSPYMEGTARLIGNDYSDGKPLSVNPRRCLMNILKEYQEKGLRAVCATEFLFFIFNPTGSNPVELYHPNSSFLKMLMQPSASAL